MAIVIPKCPDCSGPGGRAEGLVLDALEAGLSDDFFVYHRFRFIEEEEAREGESDFLVLHRELGLLVLEVKGGGVRRDGTGRWVRMVDGAEEPLRRDPFTQAQDTLHELVRCLELKVEHLLGSRGPFPLPRGYAVVFPLARMAKDTLPPEAPRAILFDAADLPRLCERVREAMAFWGRGFPGDSCRLNRPQFDSFRKKVLHPKLHLAPGLPAAAEAEGGALVRLTREQAWIVGALLENRRFRVRGGAGTGKTVLALEAARALCTEGARTLLLCFNRALAAHLQGEVSRWEDGAGRARACTFHDLCEEAWAALRGPAPSPPGEAGAAARYWNEDLPLALSEALGAGAFPRWDAVVVDEGQDFLSLWWVVVEALLEDGDAGRLFAFYDPAQTVFSRPCAVPEAYPVLGLTRMLRYPRLLGEAVARLGDGSCAPHPMCPEGEAPRHLAQVPPEGRAEALDALVGDLLRRERFRADQVTVLTPHRPEHSSLAGAGTLGGAPVSRDPLSRAGAVLHTTFGAFKGLESDVVILADIDPADPRCDRASLYAAASRARALLFSFGPAGAPRE